MSNPALALVVCAAVLHAIWNALAKRAENQFAFLWSSVSLATLLLLPLGLLRLPSERTPAAGLPFVAASVGIHALYFWALGRSYRHGDFSRVYPVARGLGVALVPLIALPVFGERLSWIGSLGVGLIVFGIVGLSVTPSAMRGSSTSGVGAGTAWAVVTGLTIAAYSLVDKAGVARLHPMSYIALMGLGLSVVLTPVVLADRPALVDEWRARWRTILVASAMNLTSYLLVLFAFRLSKVGYVVASRELSILFSAFIGSLWLGEGRLAPRLAGASVVLAGVICVALAQD
ncbi:MAG TPA: DMT family transporter [Candidatus Binatia bacterium]|nr:DMT family transporter [Candidatus Binatia bacterium]